MKKRVLIVYYTMMMGGSTTSLLGLLNCIDINKYEVDLQLYKNEGVLFNSIPKYINVLQEAFKYRGTIGHFIKTIKLIFGPYIIKAFIENRRKGLKGLSHQVISDFQVNCLSRTNNKEYDYAIGFLEGWSDRYLATKVNSSRKYAWLHNTYAKICPIKELDERWMREMDKIVCVADNCLTDFVKAHPEMTGKSITINNIIDSKVIRDRSGEEMKDEDYDIFVNTDGFKIVTVCRLMMSSKGLDRAINCAARLKHDGIKFLWYVLGDGDDKDILDEMIKYNNITEVFKLVGNKMNPYPFIKSADILCVTSRWEGKPMVVTESMILGTPPVATEYLSAKEQIKNGIEGLICDNNDDDIYDLIIQCISEPPLVRNMHEYLLSNEYGNSKYMAYIQDTLFN